MDYCMGIDVSKQSLQVFDGKKCYEVPNETNLQAWKKQLKDDFGKEWRKIKFIYEPTGPYSKTLRTFCQKNKLFAYEVNPKKSSNFAKVMGNRSKTDEIDAKMLYAFHCLISPEQFSIPQEDLLTEKLGSYLSSYELLQKSIVMLSNHISAQKLGGALSHSIQQSLDKELNGLKDVQVKLFKEMEEYILSEPMLKEDYLHLTSIPSIGVIVGSVMLYFFRKYPEANRAEITALAGLDPKRKESGVSVKGKMMISKAGYRLLRKVMYLPVMNATKHNDRISRFYLRLIERKKIKKVALIACMKKMLLIAHQLYLKKEDYKLIHIQQIELTT